MGTKFFQLMLQGCRCHAEAGSSAEAYQLLHELGKDRKLPFHTCQSVLEGSLSSNIILHRPKSTMQSVTNSYQLSDGAST